MKNFKHLFAIIAIGAVFGLFLTACPTDGGDDPDTPDDSFKLTFGVQRNDSPKDVPVGVPLTFTRFEGKNNSGQDVKKDLSEVFDSYQVSVSANNILTLKLGTPKAFGTKDTLGNIIYWVHDNLNDDNLKNTVDGIKALRVARFFDKDDKIRLQMNWDPTTTGNQELYLIYVEKDIKVPVKSFTKEETWGDGKKVQVTYPDMELNFKKGWNMVSRTRDPKDSSNPAPTKSDVTISIIKSDDIGRVQVQKQ